MKGIRWTALGLSLVLLAAGTSCGNNSIAPTEQNLTVSLVTPNGNDGAVLVALFGPAPGDIQTANAAYHVYSLTASPTEVRVLVVGDLVAGPLITLRVDDVSKIGDYHGTVVEVASRSDEIRTTLLEYDLTFAAR